METNEIVRIGADGQSFVEIGGTTTQNVKFITSERITEVINGTTNTFAYLDEIPDVSNFITNTQLTTSLLTKATLGPDGLVLPSQLPTDRVPIRGTAVNPQVTTDPSSGFTLVSCEIFNDEEGNPVIPTEEDEYFGIITKLIFRYTSNDGKFWASGGQAGIQLGNTISTAFQGNLGQIAYDYSQSHLNVDNTSDLNKPVSTATQTALNGKENTITAGTTLQYWRGDKTWQTLPTTLPNPQSLTFTGGSTVVYNGSTAQSVAIPILPTRVKSIITSRIPATGNMTLGTAYTLTPTVTVVSTQTNARISVNLTFDPDDSGFLLVDTFALKNIRIQCEFLVGATVIDTKYANIVRSDNLHSQEFITTQDLTAGQVVSIRITATSGANGAAIFVPASTTANFITII